MMRLWRESYVQRTPVTSSAAISFIAHSLIIFAWVAATLPAPGLPDDSISNQLPRYEPPPDRRPGQAGTRETIHYIDLTKEGLGEGDGPRMMGEARPQPVTDETVGRANADSVTAPPTPAIPGPQDSIFSVLDVDTAVVRMANSAAPAYPIKLLEAHVQGSVAARYVVDTTGFADMSSFEVLRATNPEFAAAVRDALPYMRFSPAKIGALKVRQLVEQQFSFKIADTAAVAAPKSQRP